MLVALLPLLTREKYEYPCNDWLLAGAPSGVTPLNETTGPTVETAIWGSGVTGPLNLTFGMRRHADLGVCVSFAGAYYGARGCSP